MFIVDRKKDLIKTSGYQVWPREIEEVLAAHPAVAEVGVAGVPDDDQGRSGQGLGRAARGPDGDRGGTARVLPRKAGAVQSAVAHRVPDRAAEDDGRQGAATRAEGRPRIRAAAQHLAAVRKQPTVVARSSPDARYTRALYGSLRRMYA